MRRPLCVRGIENEFSCVRDGCVLWRCAALALAYRGAPSGERKTPRSATSPGSVGAIASGLENEGVVLCSELRNERAPGELALHEPESARWNARALCGADGGRERIDVAMVSGGARRVCVCNGVEGSSLSEPLVLCGVSGSSSKMPEDDRSW